MKLLLDQNVSYRLVSALDDYFPGTEQVKRLGLTDNTDLQIWEYARGHGYVLVTHDADFFDLSVTLGHPPKLIWIKTGNLARRNLEILLLSKVEVIRSFYDDADISCLMLQ